MKSTLTPNQQTDKFSHRRQASYSKSTVKYIKEKFVAPNNKLYKILQEKRESMVLQEFKKVLKNYTGFKDEMEGLWQDIYSDIKNMDTLEIIAYFHEKIKQSKGKAFKGVSMKQGYECCLITLLEKMLSFDRPDVNYDPNFAAEWVIKQLGRSRTDKYQTVALLNSLGEIWLNGGLKKENKQSVKETLRGNDRDVKNYGKNKITKKLC